MITRARIDAAQKDTVPEYKRHDIKVVRLGALSDLRLDGIGDEQPEETGGRLYLLAFEGTVRYIKVGMVEGRRPSALHERVTRHLHAASVHRCFLVDAWASEPCATRKATRQWEHRVLTRLNPLRKEGWVDREFREYFYGVPFGMALAAIERERLEGEGAAPHPGVVYE
ncbi:hypothetical protein ABZ700_27585 [Streptomyces diastaticus]|uniref:hypothetical protein n=1 Tax=Streptomyces diastaticus TaxID=1956 RepID=UPI0033EC41B5